MGDPAGIGSEVIVKAFLTQEIYSACRPVVVGASQWITDAASQWASSLTISSKKRISECQFKPNCVEVLEVGALGLSKIPYGHPHAEGGFTAMRAIEAAAHLAIAKEVDAMVTAPINKEALKQIGFAHPGHTEFLAHLSHTKNFGMLMVGGGLKIMLTTIHLSLSEAILTLSKDLILEKIRLTHEALKKYFGLPYGKIAVAGLNPHAGENGLFGNEEITKIAPAVLAGQAEGINVSGPYPADTLFSRLKQGHFDAAVALYHDQALIPIKLLSFGNGINVTIGLPFIRTSVDHGTAFDIAGKGIADSGSLKEAVTLAASMAIARKRFEKLL